MIWLYSASLFFFLLASYAQARASRDIGMQFVDPTARSISAWCGGFLATLAILLLLGWGFFALQWWFPLVALAGTYLAAKFLFSYLPLGATWVIYAFPLGVIAGAAALVAAP